MIKWKRKYAGVYHSSVVTFNDKTVKYEPMYTICHGGLLGWIVCEKGKEVHDAKSLRDAKFWVECYHRDKPAIQSDFDIAMSMPLMADTEQAKKQREINEQYFKHMRETYGKPVH